MSVVADGTINPKTLISGQQIRVFDNSSSINEVILGGAIYVNEPKSVTASSSPNIYVSNTGSFVVGDVVLWGVNPPSPFQTNVNYYVVTATTTYIQLSNTVGGTALTYTTPGSSPTLYKGSVDRYPILRPYPVTSPSTRNIILTTSGSTTSSSKTIPFYTIPTEVSKPTPSSTYKDISIFIYNQTSATLINRNTSSTCNLFFTKLTFTDYITRVPIAKFTIYNPGSATNTEKDLLLAGSALNKKEDNYIAIIIDKCVAWSGKILRSTQSKAGLFVNPLVQSWDIDCEGDISRMQYQEVKTTNKGEHYLPISQIVSKLVENSSTVVPYKLINWNGNEDVGLRSNEGLSINYDISDVDMFSQFVTLSKSIDFDWRTRLTYLRYAYTYSGGVFTVGTISPYTTNSFVGRWVIATSTEGGAIYYGKCTSNSTSTLTCTMGAPSSGTILILMDPVLDIVSDLSTPTKVQSFQINTPPSPSICNGYGFNDKTDRTTLATKIIAKAKTQDGPTVTSNVAAVTPWVPSRSMFENTTTITRKTEGTVISVTSISSGADAGLYWALEGWGYPNTGGAMFYAVKTTLGVWRVPSSLTYIQSGAPPVETYIGTKRVTVFRTLYAGLGWINVGDLMIYTTATVLTPPYYGYYYVDSLVDLNYTDGMDIFIGGETITTIDSYVDPVFGPRIRYMMDGTAKHRDATSEYTGAHKPGAIIWKGDIYDETLSHSENNYSPCYYHGIISKTYMSDININTSDLEMYATLNLIKNSYYYRKGLFWCILFDWFKTDKRTIYEQTSPAFIQVGDTISCLQNTLDTDNDTLYGQPKNLWQVISYTMDANTYKVDIELGDFERNAFTQISDKTSSLHQTIT